MRQEPQCETDKQADIENRAGLTNMLHVRAQWGRT